MSEMYVQQSLSGFIASTPLMSFTNRGDARFYAKVGQEHYSRNDDGSFTKRATTFHNLVMYRRAAEHAYAKFAKGDRFVAEGYVREFEHENRDGETSRAREFIAKKLGHASARTAYTVDRPRRTSPSVQNSRTSAPAPEHGTGERATRHQDTAEHDSTRSL